MKRTIFILFPFVFLGSVAYALPSMTLFSQQFHSVMVLFPYLSIVLGMVLAWRFHRSRLFFSLFVLLLFYIILQLVEGMGSDGERVMLLVSLMLPMNLLLFGLLQERGIFSRYGMYRIYLLLAQAALVWWYMGDKSGWEWWLHEAWLPWLWLATLGLGQPAILALLLVVIWQLVRLFRSPNQVESSMLLAMLLAMLPLLAMIDPASDGVLLGLAGLFLIISLVQESYGMAYQDELTGLPGRRSMMGGLMSLGSHYSIAMLDVDHFKKFNDSYGHDAGDQVLRMVAASIGKVKGGGKPARYGGEEFAIIFPNKGVDEVLDHLEDVRKAIERNPFSVRDKSRPKQKPEKVTKKTAVKKVSVTISIGVAQREAKLNPEEVMRLADKALYRAKKKGRNRVCV